MPHSNLICAFTLVASLIASNSVHARTWEISRWGTGDAPNIQAGIDSAGPGDVVVLLPGTYVGLGNCDIDFKGKAITVTSSSGAAVTAIDCYGTARAFVFQSGEGPGSVLENVTIKRGVADYGGAILCNGSSPRIEGVVLDDNQANFDGGGIYCLAASPEIKGCTLRQNAAARYGGAIACVNSSNPSIKNNTLEDNQAAGGGGVYCENSSSPSLEYNSILRNSATAGGGIQLQTYSNGLIRGNVLCENVASNGGGIFVNFSAPTIANNTLDANSGSIGGGILCQGNVGTIQIENTLVTSSIQGAGIECVNGAVADVFFCDLYGNAGGDSVCGGIGAGNFSADPLFCGSSGSGDYFLEAGSPCSPENSPNGLLVGAYPAGCTSTGARPLPEESWGRIKSRYHRP